MFSYLSPEDRVPAKHPLRPIRTMVDEALKALSPTFDEIYTDFGRPSIAPEKLLRALLLQILYTIRSEELLMEQLQYNLLFRWFVGLNADEQVWVPTVFSKNRERLMHGDVAEKFFAGGAGTGGNRRSDIGRTLQRGWNTDRGVGEPEELSEKRPERNHGAG